MSMDQFLLALRRTEAVMTTIPTSATERWDEVADKVRKAKGKWVLIEESSRKAHNRTVKENLERRGLDVEVTSRVGLGNASAERRWVGWRTWCREVNA